MNKFKEQSGVSLYLSILILSAIMAIGLGLAGLLLGEIEISRDITRFVPAIYAADSGVERALFKIRKTSEFASCPSSSSCVLLETSLLNNATYKAVVLDPGVDWCPTLDTNKCIRAIGSLVDTNRAFEVTF